MSDVRKLSEVFFGSCEEIERVGLREYMGLESLPLNRVVDPEKCRCGGGCESVLECEFWYWLRKTRLVERGAHRQVWIGSYRVDCEIDCDGKRVIVELDGKEFHQDKRREADRDKALLRTVDAVIHIPYAPVFFYQCGLFEILGSWYPRFSLRSSLASITEAELLAEYELAKESPYFSRADWFECTAGYQVWIDHDTFGWVGSPQAYFKRASGAGHVIKHRVRHERDSAFGRDGDF